MKEFWTLLDKGGGEGRGSIWKLDNFLGRHICIVPYRDILYDQAYKMSFCLRLEFIQCNACLAITGATQDTSKGKL